jgi:uncharacterized protein YtpQ (UPF0354 family)
MGKSTHDAKTDTQFMDMMMGRAYEKAFDLAREVDVVKGSYSCAKTMDTFFRVVKKSSYPSPGRNVGKKNPVMVLSKSEAEARVYIVDSGASYHLVGKDTLSPSELKTVRRMKSPVPLTTAK